MAGRGRALTHPKIPRVMTPAMSESAREIAGFYRHSTHRSEVTLLIRLKKVRDGVVLTCLRSSGEAAVQRTGQGGFFALHDLLHYAVETTLGCREAFFGLMSDGWSFETFSDRNDPRYRSVPAEALVVEHLVNILSRHALAQARRDPDLQQLWADDITAELRQVLMKDGLPTLSLILPQLLAISDRFELLADRWAKVPLGEHLQLEFPKPC